MLDYHQQQRTETQDAFVTEQCDVVVATVAFGMGIDRSNVRYVIHAGLPNLSSIINKKLAELVEMDWKLNAFFFILEQISLSGNL